MKCYRISVLSSIIMIIISSFVFLGAQTPLNLQYTADRSYRLVERSDLSRYVNGKYVGLTQREVRAFIHPTAIPLDMQTTSNKDGLFYEGTFFVLEDTLRNTVSFASGVSDMIESAFIIAPDGTVNMKIDNGYPSLRSFPAYPSESIQAGDTWRASAIRAVDPLNKKIVTRMNIVLEYTFVGIEEYRGIPVYRIRAKWATRYREKDQYGDPDLKDASGTHNADIIVDAATGAAILIRDQLDETFFYTDGTTVRLRGSTLLFTETPPALDRSILMPALARIALVSDVETKSVPNDSVLSSIVNSGSGIGNDMLVEETKAGIRLSIRDIRFVADSDVILSEEMWRIDEIAHVLKIVPDAQFLVEGHTARVADMSNEKKLSVLRAQRVAQELSKRGIDIERFLYAGFGGEKPIASNDTEEGRAKNRRVEITILQ